jgi:Ca2+-binding EF-hand superfamily protein
MKDRTSRKAIIDLSTKSPQNEKGGIQVKDEDLSLAFEFFNGDINTTSLSRATLKNTCLLLNKNFTAKELKIMFDGKDAITMQQVKDLLQDNRIVTDPIFEAFSVLDPTNIGYIEEDRLRKIFANFGLSDLSDEELLLLIAQADFDKDGKLGIDDFRRLARPPGK